MKDSPANPAGEMLSPDFAPVPVRARHDGWTALKQLTFIQTLAESGCVAEAAKAVGMSVASAYALRRRPDAQSFREARDVALDYDIGRLADAALGRAIHGVAQPVFHNGEQVGERRKFDEKLTRDQVKLSPGQLQPCPGDRAALSRCCAIAGRIAMAPGWTGRRPG